MPQVVAHQRQAARGEVHQWRQRRGQACVVEDHSFEVAVQMAAADQVVANHRAETQPQAAALVLCQAAVAFHHHHIEAVEWGVQHAAVLAVEQGIEHARATGRDFADARARAEALFGVQLAKAAQAGDRVRQAGAGEAPGADRGADQRALAWCAGQPFTEQRQVQPLNAEGLGATSGAWQDRHVRRVEAAFTDTLHGTGAGFQGECWSLDLDGGHA
ncbi:MAG: hypothetical protein GAK45_01740 [Pseudomonas citronellolis]|nr:MAG: hypothetical protein GAK45_01740 [Pseudomonas citronellolis]